MCRSIKTLRNIATPATDEEITAAALQFVRKVSGYRKPSRRNAEAFDGAVANISEVTRRLLAALAAASVLDHQRGGEAIVSATPRGIERGKAQARA